MLIDACLGLSIDGPSQTVRLTRPLLPEFLDDMTIANLQVGSAEVDIQLHRDQESVQVAMTRNTAPVELVLQQ
jgi:hypothetical protein